MSCKYLAHICCPTTVQGYTKVIGRLNWVVCNHTSTLKGHFSLVDWRDWTDGKRRKWGIGTNAWFIDIRPNFHTSMTIHSHMDTLVDLIFHQHIATNTTFASCKEMVSFMQVSTIIPAIKMQDKTTCWRLLLQFQYFKKRKSGNSTLTTPEAVSVFSE